MRGKPFFVTKEWFPPHPFPRKPQRNKHIFSAKRIPAGAFGTHIGSHRQGADRMLYIRKNKKERQRREFILSRAVFLFSYRPWKNSHRFPNIMRKQIFSPRKLFRKSESRG